MATKQTNYKGEVKPLINIPFGSPVELFDLKPFQHTFDAAKPVYGVMTKFNDDPNVKANKYPSLKVWDGKKFGLEIVLYSKDCSRYSYRGYGVDGNIEAFKVLTGTKGKNLLSSYKKELIAGGSLPFGALGFTSGADPEIFAVDENGDVIPAWLWLPEKAKAIKTQGMYNDTGAMFWDGYQAEYTITAGTCLAYAVDYMQYGMAALHKKLLKFNPKAKLTIKNVLPVSEESLASAEEAHVTFGCKPSLNAYGAKGTIIENPRAIPFRFAGGHIHLGNGQLQNNIEEVVKMLDALIGVWAVGAFAKIDNPIRRKFYGLAGEYRKPAHGLEYRTLSNAWLCHPAIAHNVYDMSRYTASLGYSNMRRLLITESDDKVQKIINNCDVTEARKMVNKYKEIYSMMAIQRYGHDAAAKVSLGVAQNGVESVLDPDDLIGNWQLNGGWIGHSEGSGKSFTKFSRLKG